MNDLQIFTYNETPLRVLEKDGEIWWVLKDVCSLFGVANYRDIAKRLDEDEKGVVLADTPSGKQNMTAVNESGLYTAFFTMQPGQSRTATAEEIEQRKLALKAFKRWVTHEVLPQIRRTGEYSTNQPMTPAQLIAAQAQVLVDMEKRMDEMQSQTEALEAKVDTAIKVFSKPAEDHWKADMDEAIKRFCADNHLSVVATRGRMYDELERAVNCNVDSRLARLRTRKRKAGARYRDVMALTKLDAIAADKQLRAVFEGIVRKWQAQAAAGEVGA